MGNSHVAVCSSGRRAYFRLHVQLSQTVHLALSNRACFRILPPYGFSACRADVLTPTLFVAPGKSYAPFFPCWKLPPRANLARAPPNDAKRPVSSK